MMLANQIMMCGNNYDELRLVNVEVDHNPAFPYNGVDVIMEN